MTIAAPMFPLGTVLFPGARLPLHVFEERYRAMVRVCLAGERRFGVVLVLRGSEVGGGETRALVGTMAEIEEAELLPDGRSLLLVRGTARVRVADWLPDDPFPRALLEWVPEPPAGARAAELLARTMAVVRRARALLSEYEHRVEPLGEAPEGLALADATWWLCEAAPLDSYDRQRLLQQRDLATRLELLGELAGAVAEDLDHLLAGR